MSTILLDDFEGDAVEFYDLVKAEVKRREIPGVKFGESKESRVKGFFSGKEVAPVLSIKDDTHETLLLAYQFGTSFHVSVRAYWVSYGMADKEREGKLKYLEEVRSGCFQETVARAVNTALGVYLQKRQAPIPASLNPKDVFYVRQSQTSEA